MSAPPPGRPPNQPPPPGPPYVSGSPPGPRTPRRRRTVALVAVCTILAVVAAVLVVVLRDDDGPQARVRSADLLDDRQSALIRRAVPDPKCDAATPDPRPDDPSLVALDVMRVDGTCLTTTTEYLPAAQVPARREALSRDPAVVEAGVSPPMSLDAVKLPNQDDRRDNQWPLDMLGVPEGSTDLPWPDGTGVVVAVLDTGVDETHPDLAAAVVGRRHYAGEGAHDPDGHGTHVAGIVGARNDNGGITGVAPGVSILDVPVSLADVNEQGPSGFVALVWAVNHGADVANMSFGAAYKIYDTPEYRGALTLWAAAVEYARTAQVVLVASGGNCGRRLAGLPGDKHCKDRNQRQVPQAFDGVVNVGAVDRDREVTTYSTKRDDIDLVAPGGETDGPPIAPFNGGAVESDAPGGGFARIEGTSQAAPHVAAAAAIARFVRPDASADEIVAALKDTAEQKKIYVLDRNKKGSGHGLLNIPGMIDRMRTGPPSSPPSGAPPGPTPSGSPNPTGPAAGAASRTQAAYVSDGTLYAYDGATSNPVRRVDPQAPVRWLTWSSDHTLLVGADKNTLFSWAGPGTQVVEKPCDWCDDPSSRPALVDDAAVTDPSGGAATGDLVMRVSYDGTLTRFNAHTLDEIGSSPVAFPTDQTGNVTLHGSVGGKLVVHTSGGAHGAETLWLVDPVSGRTGPSHDVPGPVLGDVGTAGIGDSGDIAVSADGTKAALATGYSSCGEPDAILVLAGGDLKEIAKPAPVTGLRIDELFFNGDSLFATMSTFTIASGRPCTRNSPAGLWQLSGATWQRVDPKMTTGRPLEGRPGTYPTGWLTVRAGTAALEPATTTDLDNGNLGPVDSRVWATPTRTEVPVPPPR